MTVERTADQTSGPGRRDRTTTYGRSGRLAVLVAAAAVGLGACGRSHSPHVASLPTTTTLRTIGASRGESSATTVPKGNATVLLDEWATCMHSHGDPNQADPTVDTDKTIQIHIPQDAQQLSGPVHDGTAPCNQYLTAAQMALRNGQPFPQPPSEVTEVKFAECMRANGIPNYPNPSGPNGSETNFDGTGIDPNSRQVQNADNYCTDKLGIHTAYNSAQGDAGDIQVTSGPGNGPPPGGPGGNGGAGATPTPGANG